MFTLDLFSVANAANAVQDQQKQKILEKAFFRDAGNSADAHFSICIGNTVLVYKHIRHHRQHWLAKMNSKKPCIITQFFLAPSFLKVLLCT